MVIHADPQPAVPGKALKALARAVVRRTAPRHSPARSTTSPKQPVVAGADLALVRVPAGDDLEAVAVAGPLPRPEPVPTCRPATCRSRRWPILRMLRKAFAAAARAGIAILVIP